MTLTGVKFVSSEDGKTTAEFQVDPSDPKNVLIPSGENTFLAGEIKENGLRVAGEDAEAAEKLAEKYGVKMSPVKSPSVFYIKDGVKLLIAVLAVYGKRGGEYSGVFPVER